MLTETEKSAIKTGLNLHRQKGRIAVYEFVYDSGGSRAAAVAMRIMRGRRPSVTVTVTAQDADRAQRIANRQPHEKRFVTKHIIQTMPTVTVTVPAKQVSRKNSTLNAIIETAQHYAAGRNVMLRAIIDEHAKNCAVTVTVLPHPMPDKLPSWQSARLQAATLAMRFARDPSFITWAQADRAIAIAEAAHGNLPNKRKPKPCMNGPFKPDPDPSWCRYAPAEYVEAISGGSAAMATNPIKYLL